MSNGGADIRNLISEEAHVPPRRSLADDAADALRELILLEKLAPGIPIPERDLAGGLGISRTPLKEALRKLEIEGLVEYGPTRRPRVANPSLEELSDNLAVLASLEGLAGELACTNASDSEIDSVAALCKKMRTMSETAKPIEFFRWDMDFHSEIVSASRNEPLIETHRQYNARLWRARFISSRMKTGRDNTLRQHDDIVAAFSSRDAYATRRAMRAHLETAIVNITKAKATVSSKDEQA